jgi:hypothetical protein
MEKLVLVSDRRPFGPRKELTYVQAVHTPETPQPTAHGAVVLHSSGPTLAGAAQITTFS